MSLFDRFRRAPWSLESLPEPWAPLPSIYEHLRAGIDPASGRLRLEAETLPDEPADDGGLRWAPGALDGVMGHHAGAGDEALRTKQVAAAIRKLCDRASAENLAHLHGLVTRQPILHAIDAIIDELLRDRSAVDPERLEALGRFLCRRAGHREVVKLGAALLGIVKGDDEESLELLRVLGLHDELALFAATALARRSDEPDRELLGVAKKLHGWGRVQTVERLAESTDPEVRAWMLREGFRNSVMDEYLACICARTAGLAEALQAGEVDDALLEGAAGMLTALVAGRGGPAEGIDDYRQAGAAAEAYLRSVAARRPAGLSHLIAVDSLRRFLEEPEGWEERAENGWSAERRDGCLRACREILGWAEWPARAREAQRASDVAIVYQGDVAARLLGLKSFELFLERLRADPIHSQAWYNLLEECDERRIEEAVGLAEESLPLDSIAAGPALEPGFGEGFAAHRALDWLLQALPRFPGRGWTLVRAGLRSPVIRNRTLAAAALAAWPRDSWPAEAAALLERARDGEVDEELRERLRRLAEGRRLD